MSTGRSLLAGLIPASIVLASIVMWSRGSESRQPGEQCLHTCAYQSRAMAFIFFSAGKRTSLVNDGWEESMEDEEPVLGVSSDPRVVAGWVHISMLTNMAPSPALVYTHVYAHVHTHVCSPTVGGPLPPREDPGHITSCPTHAQHGVVE